MDIPTLTRAAQTRRYNPPVVEETGNETLDKTRKTATQHVRNGKPEAALAVVEETYPGWQTHPDARVVKLGANCIKYQSRFKDADRIYRRLIPQLTGPDQADAILGVAECAFAMDNKQEGRDFLNAARTLYPDDWVVTHNDVCFSHMFDSEKAVRTALLQAGEVLIKTRNREFATMLSTDGEIALLRTTPDWAPIQSLLDDILSHTSQGETK